MKQEANASFDRIEKLGGVLPWIQKGFFQREIAESTALQPTEIEKKERIIVGVNNYVIEEHLKVPLLRVDEAGARHQAAPSQKPQPSTWRHVKVEATLNAIRGARRRETMQI